VWHFKGRKDCGKLFDQASWEVTLLIGINCLKENLPRSRLHCGSDGDRATGKQSLKNTINKPDVVVHIYNSSYSGGRDRKIVV
jgi:hypothetical protein